MGWDSHTAGSYIGRWSRRFAAERLAGLYSPHRGQPVSALTPQLEARILDATRRGPQAGSTHWSSHRLAQVLGIFHMMAARVLDPARASKPSM